IEHNKEECMENRIVKEVLRALFKEFEGTKEIIPRSFFTKLLAKLDAPQTEKKELYKCDECEYYNGTSGCWAIKGLYDQTHPKCTFKRKASGGERLNQVILKEIPNFIFLSWNRKDSGGEKEKVCETSGITAGRKKVSKSDDSKPPETLFDEDHAKIAASNDFISIDFHNNLIKQLISEFVKEYQKITEAIEMISEEIESIAVGEWDVKEDLVGLVNQLAGYLNINKEKWEARKRWLKKE
ncbi:MAG TPA: hypothetical protein VMV43_03650, partial [Candidatus Nanopelagicaceae bacterium]|nr:hypothetical protein [Candidatus Nanopelagicaceae bacterium]